jgi:hypothetical protein
MNSVRIKIAVAALAAAAVLSAGCRTGVRAVPSAAPVPAAGGGEAAEAAPAEAPLAHLGYSVQVGAFAVYDNARALAGTLTAAGLDAFYFHSGSGIFKVRFGNFPSRDAALAEAGKLKEKGLIGEYFIVGPADYVKVRPGAPVPPVARPGPAATDLREKLVATAESFIGVDYAWGGTTTRSGFDCSGLVLAVYRLNGLAMPRSVRDQYRAGTAVSGDRLSKGDLVFFTSSPGGELSHVGIYIGDGTFIHAPGSGKNVRRESLASGYFRSRFSGARAYL